VNTRSIAIDLLLLLSAGQAAAISPITTRAHTNAEYHPDDQSCPSRPGIVVPVVGWYDLRRLSQTVDLRCALPSYQWTFWLAVAGREHVPPSDWKPLSSDRWMWFMLLLAGILVAFIAWILDL
jgi:hypothetical protein